MYIATIYNSGESTPIHNSKEKLKSGKITKGINTIDSFQFTILPSNSGYDKINDYTTLVSVYNSNRDRYEFFGRVLYSKDNMDSSGKITKDVICESYLGFLCDSQQEYVSEKNWTVGGLLQTLINVHNSQVESYKQFTLGEVTVTDPNDNLYVGIQRENTWDSLKKKLLETLGGEFRSRVVDNVIYLDYLVEIGEVSKTEIALSKNMKSITREKDPSEIVTRLIPLGCKLSEVGEDGAEVETEHRLDISAVNDGKKYIDDEEAIALYGIRVATVEWDDVTVPTTLLSKGMQWLAENNKIQVNYTVTALDLSLIGLDVDDFEVCNYHTVKNHLIGVSDTVRIIKKNIDVCEEIKSTIELGDSFESLSDAMQKQSNALGLITSDYVTNKQFTNVNKKTTTAIKQTEEKIALVVGAESLVNDKGQVQGEIVIEAVNSAVVAKIAAERIDLEGKKLNIKVDATNIEGVLKADQINADGIEAENVRITGDIAINSMFLEDCMIVAGVDTGTTAIEEYQMTWVMRGQSPTTCIGTADRKVSRDIEVSVVAGGKVWTGTMLAGERTVTITITDTVTTINRPNSIYVCEDDTYMSVSKGIMPYEKSKLTLGAPNHSWKEIYADTATINTSDEREKNSITEIPQKYSDLLYKLTPVIYKLNNGTSDRYHVGFGAQSVEKAMQECDISSQEFAGLIKSPAGDDYKYGLRYSEFIALAVMEIQKLNKKITELEKRINGE